MKSGIGLILLSCLSLLSCSGKETSSSTYEDTVAQQVADVMASVDEAGGSSGSLASTNSIRSEIKTLQAHLPQQRFYAFARSLSPLPRASAATCRLGSTWSSCASQQITHDFNNCTIGSATFSGSTVFTFSAASCAMSTTGNRVDRAPNFSVTGAFGGQLEVTKTGTNGQRLERTGASTFSFTNDGIRRVVSFRGSTLADVEVETGSAITITGNSRNGRVLDGGQLQITNNLSSTVCTLVPDNVTYNNSCNCAVSGSWSGTCNDSGSTAYELTLTGCGTGTLETNGETSSVTLNRCYTL